MSTKNTLLTEQLFQKFTTGEFGTPKIPSIQNIQELIKQISNSDIEPLLQPNNFTELNYKNLVVQMSSLVNDLDLLYNAIDKQSANILDQLTNSLREYRGAKLTLNNINIEANDILNGKSAVDNIRYVFTEDFSSTKNINPYASSMDNKGTADKSDDIPVIDINASQMYIPSNFANTLDLSHYYGKKMNIITSDYKGTIIESDFVGETDAAVILDYNNDKTLEYYVKLSDPSALKFSFVIQLNANGKKENINGVGISVDSKKTKGFIRVEYKTNAGWVPVPGVETKQITDDTIKLFFEESVSTDYLKFSILKEKPDFITDLKYYLTINDIAIVNSSNTRTSKVISKSIKIKPYSDENPVIGTIASEIKGILPNNCYANVYVAQDKIIPAYYVNKYNEYVEPQSNNKVALVPANIYTPKSQYVLLSDIIGQTNISGVAAYNNINYDWQLIKSFDNNNLKPEIISFYNINKKDPYDNTISNARKLVFGDDYYVVGLSGTYPAQDQPSGLNPWFMSGVVNETNPNWDPGLGSFPAMSDVVDIEQFIYESNYATPSGYPFNYYNIDNGRTIRFNDFSELLPGWYRPSSDIVTPRGIVNGDGQIDELLVNSVDNPYPEFYINGIKFYKIYRFEKNSEIIDSDISLYMYQTKPVNGVATSGVYDYYPHNMIWNYKDKYIEKTSTVISYPVDESGYLSGSGIVTITLNSGEYYIQNSVQDVLYYNENLLLTNGINYNVINDGPNGDELNASGIIKVDFSKLADDPIYLGDNKAIAINYSYNIVNNYLSSWNGYIIVDEDNCQITLNQVKYNGKNIVDKYKIINIETNEVITKNNTADNLNYNFLTDSKTITLNRGMYEFVVYCLTDDNGSFPANWWSPNSSDFIQVIGNARIVPEVKPLRVVSLETLLFSTTYENDYRCSVITDVDELRYVVIKEPSKNSLLGYYFHNTNRAYIKHEDHLDKNLGHYHRKYISPSGILNIDKYITGSTFENNTYQIVSGYYYDLNSYITDYQWNKGKVFPQSFVNTNKVLYPQHTTFGSPINVDDDFNTNVINSGHLFYNTAENLPSFYTITYGQINSTDSSLSNFLYKIELTSESDNLSPVLDYVKFTINTNLEQL